jgi:hypothetical protein
VRAVSSKPLVCPSCASTHPLDARFCPQCRMPLVYAGVTGVDAPVTDAQERARKIKPQYAEGELVRVAGGRNQPEAELIQGLLLEEGIPSVLQRARGFDVPDYLAAGPRDVMVAESGVVAAREVLMQADLHETSSAASGPAPGPLLAGLLAAVAVVAVIAWLVAHYAG